MPRPAFNSQQTRFLLSTLLQQPDTWRHGYELARATGLQSGTLYPLLMRLSDHGLLLARWSEPSQPGRPPRHEYVLSPAGLALAREQASAPVAASGRHPLPQLASEGALS